ncbi:MAG: hypothetical protein ACRED5_03565, partial [Propylenella sp.]
MSDLDKLESALKKDRATPRPGAREAAITAALDAYDAARAGAPLRARQGSGLFDRLRIAARAASEIMTGKRPMQKSYALAGGVSLAVLMLAV